MQSLVHSGLFVRLSPCHPFRFIPPPRFLFSEVRRQRAMTRGGLFSLALPFRGRRPDLFHTRFPFSLSQRVSLLNRLLHGTRFLLWVSSRATSLREKEWHMERLLDIFGCPFLSFQRTSVGKTLNSVALPSFSLGNCKADR